MRTRRLTLISLGLLATSLLAGCNIIREYYQRWDGEVDTSLREPTGWYQHTKTHDDSNELVVPGGLDTPPSDSAMDVPPPIATQGPTGKRMDVRPPVVPLRSELGLRGSWNAGEAIVWFERGGAHGIDNEETAWQLLDMVLKRMNVGVGKVTEGAYELTTMSADYNDQGAPYNAADLGNKALRYHQIYKLRIGRNAYGEVGIAAQLIGSMTMLSSGYMLENVLSDIELQRFAVGFANNIIRTLDASVHDSGQVTDDIEILLGRDNNDQDCFVISAPYQAVWNALHSLMPSYAWTIREYSLSNGQISFTAEEEDASFYTQRGVQPFALPDGDYKIRVGVYQDRTTVTFFDEEDRPIKSNLVGRIYSGFSQALSRELEQYRGLDFNKALKE